ARGDPGGPQGREARGARQQGDAGDGGRAGHPHGARGGRGDRAGRLGAQRGAAVRHRAAAGGAGPAHPHGVGRAVPHLDGGARPGRGQPSVRSGGGGDAHVRARVPPALSRVPVGANGSGGGRLGGGGVQRGQRGGGRAVSRGENPLRQDRRDDRARTGRASRGRCRDARGGARRRCGGAPAGAGGRVPLTLAAFVVVIGVLIFIHEAGHFAVAKVVGIQVLRFSLGFGRPILRWRRGETEYWISWIPFGGYVKMAGLEDEGMAGELEGGASAE